MNLNHVPGELLDDLLGDESSRFNLERSATQTSEPTITMPDVSSFDSADIIAELEKAALIEEFTGISADAQRVASAPSDFRKVASGTGDINPRTQRRWDSRGFTPQQRRDYCAKFR